MPERPEARAIAAVFAAVTFAVVLIPLVVLAAIVPGVPWWIGVLLALIVAGGFTWNRLSTAEEKILDRLDVDDVDPVRHADFLNLAENLSLTSGVKLPDLYVIDDPARNAGVISQAGASGLVATSGLLESVSRVELEGVVAELLMRIKSGDAETATIGAALLGMPFMDSSAASFLKPLATSRLQGALDPDRDIQADLDAVALTRYPPGLHGALAKIKGASHSPAVATEGLSYLWLVATGADEVTTFGLDERIDALAEI